MLRTDQLEPGTRVHHVFGPRTVVDIHPEKAGDGFRIVWPSDVWSHNVPADKLWVPADRSPFGDVDDRLAVEGLNAAGL